MAAGEEPELCQRLREKGWKVLRIDAEMTVHDSAMLRFGQWWKRAVRSGYGAMDVATRFRRGKDGLFVKQVKSARVWAVTWPASVVTTALLTFVNVWLLGRRFLPPREASGAAIGAALCCGGLVAALWPLQVLRLAWKARRRVGGWRTALAYGLLTMVGKFANVAGQHRYRRDRATGRNTRMIEYKSAPPHPTPPPAGAPSATSAGS